MPSPKISSVEDPALPWILEHLLTYPGTYEIPLRTMYTSNVLAQSNHSGTPALSSTLSNASSPESPSTPHFSQEGSRRPTTKEATDYFKSSLMEQISYLPSQPFSLPPAFITSFVRRCFTEDLCQVDFPQSLTALDYLKDLETRRKRDLTATLQRLGIDKETFNLYRDDLNKRYPGILEWIASMEDKERRVEALYTQVYIGLRRWTLINEMRITPFNKPNCIAMLNTLYQPGNSFSPTPQLTPIILNSQRGAFFRYIQAVEKNGKGVLLSLENQSRRPQDDNGWAVVREIVDKYLRSANSIIDECNSIHGLDDVVEKSNGRRVDSGVSFASNDRPSTSRSGGSDPYERGTNKPLPADPCPAKAKKSGTTLERIAREFRRIKSRGGETKDDGEAKSTGLDKKSLKKMKSTSALRRTSSSKKGGKHSRGGSSDRGEPLFIDEAARERLIAQARKGKENQAPRWEGRTAGRVELG